MSTHEPDAIAAPAVAKFSPRRMAALGLLAMAIALPVAWLIETNLPGARQGRVLGQGQLALTATQFQLDNATIPQREIHSGGPPKDGIPALSNPAMLAASEASYLAPEDRVIGVALDGDVRAYPLRILNYHEIVNDQLNTTPIAVTYCPLCDSAAVFQRDTPRGVREFGVSGLLYNSNVLMYDRDDQAESLWSQLMREAVSGPQVRNRLQPLPLTLTTWGDWSQRYPSTTVLSNDTGHGRDYSRSPYGNYFVSPTLMFPVTPTSDRLPTKAKVLGVQLGNKTRAYPYSAFSAENPRVADNIDGKPLVLEFNPQADSLRVVEANDGIDWMYSFWFSWYAMHPETEVYESPPQ
ncbi:MAG: DUF3179 domain-containing protein [Bythopirellula sp.]